ncbi:MAG: hypothetical protein KBT34_09075 [Prevotella sp.]|nr:hypothetical protein [Candidatus Prevotella equi]
MITYLSSPSLTGRAGVGLLFGLVLLSSCSENDIFGTEGTASRGDVINVGGIDTDDMLVTQEMSRAVKQDADKVDWLVAPLKAGLDITYGNFTVNEQNQEVKQNSDVAILKLTDPTTTPATYEFNYRQNGSTHKTGSEPAIWHGNGSHFFEGVHVPERIRYDGASGSIDDVENPAKAKAPGLTSDQHNAAAPVDNEAGLGNYTLLAHYLGMPANTRITATVSRIKLPFRHRLARVVAFVLIDPILNTHLKGYEQTVKDDEGNITSQDDPNTTSFRFNNVYVLQGVKDIVDGGHHTLTPQWKKARKVIPHFEGEKGSYSYKDNQTLADDFILYTKTDGNKETKDLYPTSSDWQRVHKAADHEGYTAVNYGKVPVYDIIVRPTYTDADHVMYDEDLGTKTKTDYAKAVNSIDFEIELENGLNYEKNFEFDLDANYQTVVYLRISREQVDYDAAGSELWIESKNTDAWYGVDNENGNTLSKAGSSWQRAYRSTTISETAGTTSGVTDGDFYNSTTESVGQYLGSTDKWTELLLQACEGGKHHGDYFILDHDITINAQQIPANFVFTGHLDAQDHIITLTGTGADTYEETTKYSLAQTETLYNKVDGNYVEFHIPTLYISEEVAQAKPAGGAARTASETIPVGPDMMTLVTPTLAQVMTNDVVYYEKVGSDYRLWNPRSWTFYTHRISAGSLFCGLNGTYTTAQEKAANPYAEGFKWEANVHKESNKSTKWVPTMGYRAEVLNAKIEGGKLFSDGAVISGNVQNCFDKDKAVTHNPNIPQYK